VIFAFSSKVPSAQYFEQLLDILFLILLSYLIENY